MPTPLDARIPLLDPIGAIVATAERYEFASDNVAGLPPQVLEAIARSNDGAQPSYGEDPLTRRTCDLLREIFETDCEVYFVFNGTAANALALAAMCRPYHSVLAHAWSHVMTDECGAVEFYTGGARVTPITGELGQLTPSAVREIASRRRDLHASKPAAISLTQATEVGTVYRPGQIEALAETARSLGLKLHMDGARFANALVSLAAKPADLTWRAGVDVLSLGGTKVGGAIGDAVIFFDKSLAQDFEYRCKQAGQLASKMRFVSAVWLALLEDDLWLRLAKQANDMASRMRQELSGWPIVRPMFPTEANGVFVRLPAPLNQAMEVRGWHYYDLLGDGGSRLMCSWATTDEHIADFLSDFGACASNL